MYRTVFFVFFALAFTFLSPVTSSALTEVPNVNTSASTGVPAAYVPVLDNMYDVLAHGLRGRDWEDGEYGVMERWAGNEGTEALSSVGWALRDLNGDGSPELLIAPVDKENGKNLGCQLYSIHTIKDGKAQLVLEGMSRSSYTLWDDEQYPLSYHGSGGAMISIFGVCGLSKDGTKLVWRDYYFSHTKGKPGEIGYYSNTTGKLDKSSSTEIRKRAFDEAEECVLSQLRREEFTLFSDWKKADANTDTVSSSPAVRLLPVKDALRDALSHQAFTAGTEEPQVQIAVCAQRPLKNIKVLKLDVDVDDNGKVNFKSSDLFSLDRLEPRRPLVLSIPMLGSIPHYGISYVENGKTYSFAVTQSGEDGSLLLMPF